MFLLVRSVTILITSFVYIPASKFSNPRNNNTLSSLEKLRRPATRDSIIRNKVENNPIKALWKRKKYVNQCSKRLHMQK